MKGKRVHLTHNQTVAGSIPARPTLKNKSVTRGFPGDAFVFINR